MPDTFEIRTIEPHELDGPLRLLEKFFRDSITVSNEFREGLKEAMERRDLEVISAFAYGEAVGVMTLAFRPSISLGGTFASIEDLYVEPGHRGHGIGRALLREAEMRCRRRGISYLEAQVEEETVGFYAASGFGEEDVRVISRSLPVDDHTSP